MSATTRVRAKLFVAAVFAATFYAYGCSNEPSAPEGDSVDQCCAVVPINSQTLQLEAVVATELRGTVATPVSPVPTLIVKTPGGQPVSGIRINFSPAGGDEFSGSVRNTTAVTNGQGIATPGQWILGTRAGTQELVATLLADGPTRSVTFKVQSAPATSAQLFVHWSADRQVGLPNWEVNAPAIWITDRFGNRTRLRDVIVHFVVATGGGRLAKKEALTDSAGFASAEGWTLGPSAGLNSVIAIADDVGAATLTAVALDPRELTWYDLEGVENQSSPIERSSIGLSGNGFFVAETYYGKLGRHWLGGNYTLNKTELFFDHYTGTDIGPSPWNAHSVVGDRLSIVWCPPWYDCGFAVPPAEEIRTYSKRKS